MADILKFPDKPNAHKGEKVPNYPPPSLAGSVVQYSSQTPIRFHSTYQDKLQNQIHIHATEKGCTAVFYMNKKQLREKRITQFCKAVATGLWILGISTMLAGILHHFLDQ
jgi:hypothetical protein